MKNKNKLPGPFVLYHLVLATIFFLGVSLITGCGSADATAKKEKKSKKSKVEETEGPDVKKADEKTAEDGNTASDEEKETEPVKNANVGKNDKNDGKKIGKTDEKSGVVSKTDGDRIWQELVKGNKRFMSGGHTSVNFVSARKKLVNGQEPAVIILGCADSRVPPEFVFDKNLGEIFVVRDAGNIPDKLVLGSMEYAVEHLHSRVIVILGHESCGAVAAAVSGEEMPTANLREIVDSITPAFQGSKTCIVGKQSNLSCVEANVRHSADEVLARSPVIKKAVEKGELTIIRAVYHMETGEVVRVD
jgi:carbonic anhydrase